VNDRITLTIPRERPFHHVAHLVIGGLAVRLNFTLDSIDDLQVALDELLEQDDSSDDVTVDLRLGGGAIEAEIGPFDAASLGHALDADGDALSLERVLATVVDSVSVADRDGGRWIVFSKSVTSTSTDVEA
jgi:hypothetical protein